MKQEKVYVEGYVVGFMVVPTGNVEKQIQVSSGEYEVEKERRYLVTLKNGQPLVKSQPGNTLYFNQNITAGNYKASRKELEEAGFGWVFDCPGIEIKEV